MCAGAQPGEAQLGKSGGLAALDSAADEAGGASSGRRCGSYWCQLAALSLGGWAHSYAIASIYAYSGFYVVDMGWIASGDVDEAGYIAGALAAALPFGRVFTSSLWG
eukprot:4596010-Prymnesium_polylepis.1